MTAPHDASRRASTASRRTPTATSPPSSSGTPDVSRTRASGWTSVAPPPTAGSTTSPWPPTGTGCTSRSPTRTSGSGPTTPTTVTCSPRCRPRRRGRAGPQRATARCLGSQSHLHPGQPRRTHARHQRRTDVVLVDPETMAVTTRLRGHTHRVIATEFSSDDRLVAASALDGSTLVWDRETGALLERLEGIRMPVESLAFAPDSETLYGSVDGSVLVWDLAGSRRFVSTVSAAGRFVRLPRRGRPRRAVGGVLPGDGHHLREGHEVRRRHSARAARGSARRLRELGRLLAIGGPARHRREQPAAGVGSQERPSPQADEGARHRPCRGSHLHPGRIVARRR